MSSRHSTPQPDADVLARAMDRAVGARAIEGNVVEHHADSPSVLAAMLAMIGQAQRRVHLENYIIRDDHTGRRFADALIGRAAAGAEVSVLYDSLGCRGTPRRFWQRLRKAGVLVRGFNPVFSARPLDALTRNHRKLLVVDGRRAMLGGVCIGDEWAGDPARGRQPWRDTAFTVTGPAALALDGTFDRVWARAGPPGKPEPEEPPSPGDVAVRVVEGVPGRARISRAAQLAYASALERIWITDAYLLAPPPLQGALLDAARDGIDVRVLVPGISDAPLVQGLTRMGYGELLDAGIRVFEWTGPMLHAKSMVVDRRWARVGSSNLNVSSLYANYELDVLVESPALCEELAAQFRRDLAASREIVLRPRRYLRRLTGVPGEPGAPASAPTHRRSLRERRGVAAVALRRIAGGLRRRLFATGAVGAAVAGTLILLFPTASSVVLGAGAMLLAVTLGLEAARRRRRDDGP